MFLAELGEPWLLMAGYAQPNAVTDTGRKTVASDIKNCIFLEIKILKIHHKTPLKFMSF